jgi:hypothetical protein
LLHLIVECLLLINAAMKFKLKPSHNDLLIYLTQAQM